MEEKVIEIAPESIYVSLCKLQGSLTTVEKKRKGYNFTYADLSDIWDMIRKPLAENGFALIQLVESEEGRNYIITQLHHTSGQMIQSKTLIEFTAKKFQEVGTAITYYRRYALSAMLGIVSDEDVDDKKEENDKLYSKSKELQLSEKQIKTIEGLINGHEDIRDKIKAAYYFLKNIPVAEYEKVVKTIKQLIKDKEKKNENS